MMPQVHAISSEVQLAQSETTADRGAAVNPLMKTLKRRQAARGNAPAADQGSGWSAQSGGTSSLAIA